MKGNWVARLGACLIAATMSFASAAMAEPAPDGGKFKVVTTFTVLQDIAQNVAGDKAEVVSITKPGAEIHDYQPTPLDIVKAQEADLVLWNGFNLERWFEKFYGNVEDVPSVVLTDGIEPMGIREGPYTGKPNPHAWMSPSNALVYVENIRKALVKYDPANADSYNRNAGAYAAKIKALDEPLRKRLSAIPEGHRWLVTSEGAFSYLTRDYGLNDDGVVGARTLAAMNAPIGTRLAQVAVNLERMRWMNGDPDARYRTGNDYWATSDQGPGPQVMAADTLTGDEVRNGADEKLGEITDIMLDVPTGRVAYAVMSVGGVLGIGNKLFAIPWSAMQLDTDGKCFRLNVARERFDQAPGFDKDHWPSMADQRWAEDVHAFYEARPYWS